MKNFIKIMGIFLLAVAVSSALLLVKPLTVNTESSEIYSQEEVKSAVAIVKKDFKSLHGCKLFFLACADDEEISRETEHRTEQDSAYEEYIVIDTAFLSPIFGGGAWESAQIYKWHWILGRNNGTEWKVIDKGY